MPCDYKKYPTMWRAVSKQIRFVRAAGRCECTGQCGKCSTGERCSAINYQPHPITKSKVVLTVAHQCECEPLCAEPTHLLAMCNRCHLNQDAPLHARNASRTRRGQRNNQELFPF